MRQKTCRQMDYTEDIIEKPSPGTHFSLAGDRLYQLAQAHPHNVLHFLVMVLMKFWLKLPITNVLHTILAYTSLLYQETLQKEFMLHTLN